MIYFKKEAPVWLHSISPVELCVIMIHHHKICHHFKRSPNRTALLRGAKVLQSKKTQDNYVRGWVGPGLSEKHYSVFVGFVFRIFNLSKTLL